MFTPNTPKENIEQLKKLGDKNIEDMSQIEKYTFKKVSELTLAITKGNQALSELSQKLKETEIKLMKDVSSYDSIVEMYVESIENEEGENE